MLEFISSNLATVIVGLVLLVTVTALVRSLVKGKVSCGPCSGDCGSCGACGEQHDSCQCQSGIKIKRIGEDNTKQTSQV